MNRRHALRRCSTTAALLLALALSGACKGKAKAGDPCGAGQGVCVDGTTMMACVKGAFATMPCHGALGCATQGTSSQCDNSLASVGDVCDEVGDYACSADKKSALSCKDGKFVIEETCKGTRGCALKKDGLYCDNDLSDLGDPCHQIGDYACTSDKKLALKCGADRTMAALNTCKGTKGCRVFEMPEEKKVEFVCDDAVADPNDPCDENGEKACTIDRKGILECKQNKFQPLGPCPGGCTFDTSGDKFECGQAGGAATGTKAGTKKGGAGKKGK
jgi:hypothetical protein